MAMRELVTGGAACAVPGSSSSSSNPLGAFASALMGSSSQKIWEFFGGSMDRIQEIPTSIPTTSGSNIYEGPSTVLPGSEFDHPLQPDGQGSEFLRGFRSADQNGLAAAWDEIHNPQAPQFQGRGSPTNFPLEHNRLQPDLGGPPQRVLSSFLHSFVNSTHGGVPFRSAALPVLGLSDSDKQCIRDRSSIMARHFFGDKSEDFVNSQPSQYHRSLMILLVDVLLPFPPAFPGSIPCLGGQVNALLSSLEIDNDIRARGPLPGRFRELEEYWNDSQVMKPGPHAGDGWVAEFTQHRVGNGDPNAWAHSFEQQHGANGWASEFDHDVLNSALQKNREREHKHNQNRNMKPKGYYSNDKRYMMNSRQKIGIPKGTTVAIRNINSITYQISTIFIRLVIADFAVIEQSQITTLDQMRGANIPSLAAMEQTRMLAHTLAQNGDPKFQKEEEDEEDEARVKWLRRRRKTRKTKQECQVLENGDENGGRSEVAENSKFFQFVSKMSRGELSIGDNQVKPIAFSTPGDWATEYQHQYNGGQSWADQFVRDEARPVVTIGGGIRVWMLQRDLRVPNLFCFSQLLGLGVVLPSFVVSFSLQSALYGGYLLSLGPDRWVNEYTTEREHHGSVDDQWVNEFSKLHVHDWVDEFGRQVGEGALGDESDDNWANAYDEYLNEQSTVKQRSETSRGVYVFSDLNPYVGHPNPLKEGQELFRKGLLSEAVLALEAEVLKNPDNAEGWRLLGIAHAENDDDQQAIASMMRAQEVEPTNLEVLLALGVARFFNDAAQMSPEDADVHVVLGVLYNLSREYDKAIESFKMALKLKPRDYSLWNKLGATQANSVQSADAILAYQQALDLKPNYVRAWANMGISYANQGMYEDSIRYYVRALAMNPKADNAWQYLRISLSCASRNDMIEACDSRNLDVLQKEFPL
ncbi:hypothetical protein LguiA_035810 [Lonicera macranthoides]